MDAVSLKQAALEYAAAGIPVFPLHHPLAPGVCSCIKRNTCGKHVGKHPRHHQHDLPNGCHNATTDPRQIDVWWDRWPNANIGVATGGNSGIVVVDLDGAAGVASLKEILGEDVLNSTMTVQTGSGGIHLYYKSNGRTLPNTVKSLPGVDVRGDAGHVVAPPSLHSQGSRYVWISEDFNQPQPLPSILADLLFRRPDARLTQSEWGETLEEGRRDQEIARRAGKLLRGDVPASVVLETLRSLNAQLCAPPLPDADIQRIVASIDKKEKARRLQNVQQQVQTSNGQQSPPTPAEFPVITWAEALQSYGEYDTQWHVPNWLPQSTVGLVGAPPGSYKTWILADMCTAMTGERLFLNQYEVEEPGPVLIVQQEDFMPMLISRIGLMLGAGKPTEESDGLVHMGFYRTDIPLYFHDRRMLRFDDPKIVEEFKKRIGQIKPRLVMIDPLYSAVSMDDYMAKSAQTMMVLKDLRDMFGTSFMIAHHTVKKKNEDGRERDQLWGSQFLNAWLETGWQMRQSDVDPTIITVNRHFKVCQNPPLLGLRWGINDWAYSVELCGDIDQGASDTELGKTLLALIDQQQFKSIADIAAELGVSGKGSIGRALKQAGIEKRDGYYQLVREIEMEEDD